MLLPNQMRRWRATTKFPQILCCLSVPYLADLSLSIIAYDRLLKPLLWHPTNYIYKNGAISRNRSADVWFQKPSNKPSIRNCSIPLEQIVYMYCESHAETQHCSYSNELMTLLQLFGQSSVVATCIVSKNAYHVAWCWNKTSRSYWHIHIDWESCSRILVIFSGRVLMIVSPSKATYFFINSLLLSLAAIINIPSPFLIRRSFE